MSRFLQALTVSVATATVVVALIVASAQFARAQQADSEDADWQGMGPGSGVATESDKSAPPLDVAGCWSGSIDDSSYGSGTGFIFFVQKVGKIVKGTNASLTVSAGTSSGSLTGKVTSTSFFISLHKKNCKASFSGQISSGDLVGSYKLHRCHLGTTTRVTTTGTFDFTFDASGDSC